MKISLVWDANIYNLSQILIYFVNPFCVDLNGLFMFELSIILEILDPRKNYAMVQMLYDNKIHLAFMY